MRVSAICLTGLFLLITLPARAATSSSAQTIPLYPDLLPSDATELNEVLLAEPRVRNVTAPTLMVFSPVKGKANGLGVIVAPGGGFQMLSIESEGEQVAQWLNAHGITAFVLKYRLNETPKDSNEFIAQFVAQFQKPPAADMVETLAKTNGAQEGMADGLQAVRIVRKRASDFGVDPQRIGFLGFSAGAMVAMHVATAYDADSRPDFVGAIYGAKLRADNIRADAPPLFLAVAADDPLLANASQPIFAAWRDHQKSAELHVYSEGGHGFGMKKQDKSSDHWIDEYSWWLAAQHLIEPKK